MVLALASPQGQGQWSSDPALNLSLADSAGDQVQAKLVARADGGAYVSWFDGGAGGYDLRLQRIDVDGFEAWPHGGLLVADRGFSSTQDYGLSIDASGAALLSFRDDRAGGVQISASRVSPAGTLLWGTGVQLTNTSSFVGAPKITGTDDGQCVVAWTQDSSTAIQRLASDGTPQWSVATVLTPVSGAYLASDLHGASNSALLSVVHQTGSQFWAPKHLKAFKLDSGGGIQWGPVAVFDGDSLQFGSFPTFVPDGVGGGLFAWYGTGPLECYAQHIRADGSEAFPHNGVSGSTDTARVRVDPSISYDADNDRTYLFWTEQNAAQTTFGLRGQLFDASGNRQWAAAGSELLPLAAAEVRSVRASADSAGVMVVWTQIPAWGQDRMYGARVDGAGAFSVGPFDVSSTPSGKSRLQATRGGHGQLMLAWSDDRTGADDILAQAIQADGSLGQATGIGQEFCSSTPNSSGQAAVMAASGSTGVAADDLVLEVSGIPNQMGIFFYGTARQNGGAGVPFGNGLLCVGGQIFRLLPPYLGSFQAASRALDIAHPPQASGQVTAGSTWHFQAWYRDPLAGGASFDLSDGLTVVFTP
ncbi:MAG: hypothetical protein QF599_00705 [Planctomycetota bacterium]|nr:hypothetical protein [Planctomycetota bacterium]MDP6954464.1 hypothetical protein [Planctomycetota bacterium]